MRHELGLFTEWFLQAFLNLRPSGSEQALLDTFFEALVTDLAAQPVVFTHRDYHSRNLMMLRTEPSLALGVIDFQDAVRGPIAYDLVSLLKDCYVQWPQERIQRWVSAFYSKLDPIHAVSLSDFVRGFDLCGLQRHLKILGVFCRLKLRDNKAGYLQHLPLTFHYAMDCLERYQEFEAVRDWMSRRVHPLFLRRISS